MTNKRLFDMLFSSLGLVLLSPLFLLIALRIKMETPGPVFFRQERVGRFEKLFRIHKFRTMVVETGGVGPLLTCAGDSRVTRFGSFLRKHKMDELPQLIDVFIGDMSLVGPRPEVQKYVDYYPDKVKETVFSVLPGITDLAAITYKEENTILACASDPERAYIDEILPQKLIYYEEYVRNRTLSGDAAVILKTLKSLFVNG